MDNTENTLSRCLDERFEPLGKVLAPRTPECGSSRRGLVRGELIGVEAERAGTLGVSEVLVKLLGREASEFLAVERPNHRFVTVASIPLDFADFVDLSLAEVKPTNYREKIRVFVNRFCGLAFEPPDGRLKLGCLL